MLLHDLFSSLQNMPKKFNKNLSIHFSRVQSQTRYGRIFIYQIKYLCLVNQNIYTLQIHTWTGMGVLHKGFQRTRFVVTYCIQKWLTLMKKETRYEAHLWHNKGMLTNASRFFGEEIIHLLILRPFNIQYFVPLEILMIFPIQHRYMCLIEVQVMLISV